jgi:hypothetical protein
MMIGNNINEENCNNIYNNVWFLTDKSVNLLLKNFVWTYVHNEVRQNTNEINNIRL